MPKDFILPDTSGFRFVRLHVKLKSAKKWQFTVKVDNFQYGPYVGTGKGDDDVELTGSDEGVFLAPGGPRRCTLTAETVYEAHAPHETGFSVEAKYSEPQEQHVGIGNTLTISCAETQGGSWDDARMYFIWYAH